MSGQKEGVAFDGSGNGREKQMQAAQQPQIEAGQLAAAAQVLRDLAEESALSQVQQESGEKRLANREEVRAETRIKGNSLILNTVVRWVVYVILIFAFYLFWNGHNSPGGGFIAGLMTAGVVVLLYVSYGSQFIRTTLRFDFKYLIGIGLSISLLCGIGAMVFGYPFLTHTFGEFHIPLLGQVELATATVFDLGVYLVVTGGCVTIITTIGESGYHDPTDSYVDEAADTPADDGMLDR